MAGEARLGEVAEIIMGQSPPGETYNEVGEGLPFFQGVADFNYRFPTPRVYCTAPSRIAEPGDILLSVRAPIGRVNVAHTKCATGRGLSIIRARKPDDSRYLEFALRALEGNWAAIEGSGSVFGNATRRDLEELPLPWQSKASHRKAIAHILGTLDDKIELNRKQNETLEAMAQALFKAWFVDFEPVRAKCRGTACRAPTGWQWPQYILDLFPDRLVESELGEIPEGWEARVIGDLADVSSGKRPNIRYQEASAFAHVPLWGGNGPMGFVPEALIDFPILLTSRVGTLGSVFRVTTPCWPSDNTLVLKAKHPRSFEYLFLQLKRIDFASLNRGSTQPLLTQTDLKSQLLPLPRSALLERFHSFAKNLYSRIDASEHESRSLAQLRDTLLPKLISGELRVKDAEAFLKERGL